jgi:hypothetical protein
VVGDQQLGGVRQGWPLDLSYHFDRHADHSQSLSGPSLDGEEFFFTVEVWKLHIQNPKCAKESPNQAKVFDEQHMNLQV